MRQAFTAEQLLLRHFASRLLHGGTVRALATWRALASRPCCMHSGTARALYIQCIGMASLSDGTAGTQKKKQCCTAYKAVLPGTGIAA